MGTSLLAGPVRAHRPGNDRYRRCHQWQCLVTPSNEPTAMSCLRRTTVTPMAWTTGTKDAVRWRAATAPSMTAAPAGVPTRALTSRYTRRLIREPTTACDHVTVPGQSP